jgi:putative flippase GtrA
VDRQRVRARRGGSAPEAATPAIQRVIRRRGVRQFVKFCVVGAGSTLIDFGIFFLLIEIVHLQGIVGSADLARAIGVCIAFLFAVTNGFYWNSRWTFRARPGDPRTRLRYAKFVLTNLVGLGLNVTVTLIVARLVPPALSSMLTGVLRRDPAAFIGKVVATGVVVFWNFSASKYWTFRS